MKLLVANRGEIAVRVLRAAAELGYATVAVASEDDADSPHLAHADEQHLLPGKGPAAYLDGAAILDAAAAKGAGAIHPGYGFLSERASFARACDDAGVVFVGPSAASLEALGDKAAARARAAALGIPVLEGAATLSEAATLLAAQGPGGALMVKAAAGGGGRGLRRVTSLVELEDAWERCASEASAAFGDATLYAERFLSGARHIEVQVLGDSGGALRHLGERECSLQRRHQKVVEIAPSPSISAELREEIAEAAVQLATDVGLQGLTEQSRDQREEQNVELFISPRFSMWRFNTPELDLRLGFDLYPSLTDWGRVRSKTDLNLRWEIVEDLFFDLTAWSTTDNESESGKESDYGVTTGLGWEF